METYTIKTNNLDVEFIDVDFKTSIITVLNDTKKYMLIKNKEV